MTPAKAAFQLSHLWRSLKPREEYYPVDCRLLAAALNIKVYGDSFEDGFEAMLCVKKKQTLVIYNEDIREEGRKNFAISHELGHHSLHKNQDEFMCSISDLSDSAPHPSNIEQEANLFAAMLLMPADDFRSQILGQPISLGLLSELASHRYQTSLTATCHRVLDVFDNKPLAMIRVRGNVVISWRRTEEMKWTGIGFRKGHCIESSALSESQYATDIDSILWLNEKNAPRWQLKQSTVHMPYYGETLVLLQAFAA